MYSLSTSMAEGSRAAEDEEATTESSRPPMVRSSSSSSGSCCCCVVFFGIKLVGTPGLAKSEKRGLPALPAPPDVGPFLETGGLFSSLSSNPAKRRILDIFWVELLPSRSAADPHEGRDFMGLVTRATPAPELANAVDRRGRLSGESEMCRSCNDP